MRLRNVKNKEEIINNSKFLIKEPKSYKGKWKDYFKNSNDIEIEIGMGKGKFIIEKAINNPSINYIGIEKYDSVVSRALEKIPDNISNLAIIRMNAMEIDEVFGKEISKLYLNFSDPWPKKRHNLRRLTSKVFLEKYENIFKNSKIICQKTDNKDLFEYSLINMSNNGYIIKELSFDLHNSEYINDATTEYEDRFTSKGNNIYYVKCEK